MINLASAVDKIVASMKSPSGGKEWPKKTGRFLLLAFLFLSPFFFLPITSEPANGAKNILLAFFSLTAFLCAIVSFVKERRISYPKSFLTLTAVGFLVVFALSSVFSRAGMLSLYGGGTRYDSLMSLIFYLLSFFSAFYFFEKEDLGLLAYSFFGGVAVLDVLTLLQLFGALNFSFLGYIFTPAGSFFGWGITLGLSFVLLLETSFRQMALRTKFLAAAFAALTLFSLYILNFSTLWLVLAFVLIIHSSFKFAGGKRFVQQMVFATLFLSLFFVGSHLPVLKQAPSEIRPDLISTLKVSGAVVLGPRILLGSGPATFGLDWTLHKPAEINNTQFFNVRFSDGFDFYLLLLATVGIVGLLAFLATSYALFRQILREPQEETGILGAALLFLIAIWFFETASVYHLLLFFLGLGLVTKFSGKMGALDLASFSKKRLFAVFIVLMFLAVLSLSAIFSLSQKYAAAIYNGKALRLERGGDVAGALIHWDSATALDGSSDVYWRNMSQALLAEAERQANGGALTVSDASRKNLTQVAQFAISAAQRATNVNTADPDNWTNLGSVYERLMPLAGGALDAAVQSYDHATSLDPKNPDMPMILGRIYATVFRGGGDAGADYAEKATDAFQKSIDLKPDYALPRFMLGQLFYETGQYSAAKQMLESSLNLDASNLSAHYFLGLIYDKLGNRDGAIQQFKLLLSASPSDANLNRILGNLEAGRGALQNSQPAPEKPKGK